MIFAIKRIMDNHWEYNQPLFAAFLDLEKVFNRVLQDKLWEMLEYYGIPYCLHRAVISTYEISISTVSIRVGENLWFETTTWVRQGSIQSPLLFIMYIELLIREVAENQPLTNVLANADDVEQLDNSEEGLQNHLILYGLNALNGMGLSWI